MRNYKNLILSFIFLLAITWFLSGNSTLANSQLKGVALKDVTHVYTDTSVNSKPLKSYSKGSILIYERNSTDSNWYNARVSVNGKWHNGYINKNDVDTAVLNQQALRGIALNEKTNVFSSASSNSKILKSYQNGSILQYRTFSTDWYEATVYVGGKPRTGYIHKNHVENAFEKQENLKGIGLKNPTSVYRSASTNSSAWKTYAVGSILQYKTFSSNWYEATVYVGGRARTGYIHKSHVENSAPEQTELSGIALQNSTAVFQRADTNSKPLKTYAKGRILKYKTFSSNWYEATVYVNGKARTGYIHAKHVENLYNERKPLNGAALKSPTNVYSRAADNSKVLKSYDKGSFLIFDTFSPNWYIATVILNGKPTTGYIYHKDVSTDRIIHNVTTYNFDFNKVIDIQMGKAPQVSGKNGGWVDASRKQVEYYANPSNFDRNSSSYFQFLVLSQPASLNVNEINQKILSNAGVLKGKAEAFIKAGDDYNINEAYLISHAFLETGRGTSDLAKGVPVDKNGNVVKDEKEAVYTVYNTYGIGALDECPLECGAKTAFDKGWFTVEDAIIGGAGFINEYIDRGQDTLYKMRWNPKSPGHPQYATDVAWAVKQTTSIKQIYDLLDNYVLIYDVPRYNNQPASSGDPNAYLDILEDFPTGTKGITTNTSVNLNMREGSSTGTKSIDSIPSGTVIEILGTQKGQTVNKSDVWYKINYNNKTGYVHSSYVELLNLLEVTASNLHVRQTPGGTSLGRVSNVKLSAVLDDNNRIITQNEWYRVYYNGNEAWVSGGPNGTEYIKIIK